jgi:esterase/lipase superfamily enzyme
MPTLKNTKKNLPQSRIPRISTRGFYDLGSGKTLKKESYDLYPKKFFDTLGDYAEFTIMIHGLRNNKAGALAKFRIAQKRLRQLGYKHPVVGFSYDSNTKGVQYKSCEPKATHVGRIIAKKNGTNLAKFIADFKKKHPKTRIRLMGHSLGTEVIISVLVYLAKRNIMVDRVYFFGSSLPANFIDPQRLGRFVQKATLKITNYYGPNDDVLKIAYLSGIIAKPVGYLGVEGKTTSNYAQKRLATKNHRFASYMEALKLY